MPEQFDGSQNRETPYYPPTQGIITGSLREGWDAIKRDPILLIGLSLLLTALFSIFTGALPNILKYRYDLFEIGNTMVRGESGFGFLRALSWLVFSVLRVGMLYTALRVVRREPVPFNSIFSGFPRIIHIVIADILVSIAVFWGLILLIIPGIFFAVSFSMRGLLIMERDDDCITALKGSWQMMKGYRIDYFLLWVILLGINFVGLIPLGLGLIITVPLSYAAIAAFFNLVYKENPPHFTD
jgi:uncharacterized membrane protein